MFFAYLFIVGIPALLVLFFARRISRIKAAEKNGQQTQAAVTGIYRLNSSKGTSDVVTFQYQDTTGQWHAGKITTGVGQYAIGDSIPLKYSPGKASFYIIKGMEQGQWVLLIFCLLILIFMIFASYKLNEMVESGAY